MSLSMSQTTPLDKDADVRTRQEEETAGEMDITIETSASGCVTGMGTMKHRNSGSKPPYQAFLGQLYALIEGAIDGNRYEDSCRQLLGNESYTLFGLDKVIQQTLKCLQAMTNDESVNKLIGLFVYHKSKGRVVAPYSLSSNGTANSPSSSFSTSIPTTVESVAMDVDTVSDLQKEVESSVAKVPETDDKDPGSNHNNNVINDNSNNSDNNSSSNGVNSVDVSRYQAHVSRVLLSFAEDIYRIQLLSLGNFESDSEYQHVACQCLGVLGLGGVPVYSPPAIASLALSTAAAAAAVQGNVSSSLSLSLPSSSTTFASISNVIATVYDVAGLVTADDLSTSALEDALLPPQPPSSVFPLSLPLSHSGSQIALNNDNIMIVRKEREREGKEIDGSYSRGNAENYWNTSSHNEEIQHYNTVKNKNGNETSISQKHENNMNIKEEDSVGDSVNIKAEITDSHKSDFSTDRIAKNDCDRETDLNMNGEAINVAEMDGEMRESEEGKGGMDVKDESMQNLL